jgi:hypothetical protein
MDLQTVSATLAAHLATADTMERPSGADTAASRPTEGARRMAKITALSLALFVSGMGAMGMGKLLFHSMDAVVPGFVILMAGLLLLVYGLCASVFFPASKAWPSTPRTNPLAKTNRTIDSAPPDVSEPAASVTERTTQLIDR